MQCDLSFNQTNAMRNGVLRVVPFKIHFLTCFSSVHNKISLSDANIDALYASSLRIKIEYFVLELFYIYKWCVTKVAHCTFSTFS